MQVVAHAECARMDLEKGLIFWNDCMCTEPMKKVLVLVADQETADVLTKMISSVTTMKVSR